jgi:hypothetical protein
VYAFDAAARGVLEHDIEAIVAGREPPVRPRRPSQRPRASAPPTAEGDADSAQMTLDLRG